ncbi:MAG: ribonuclease III [Chloroflexia bacterium]
MSNSTPSEGQVEGEAPGDEQEQEQVSAALPLRPRSELEEAIGYVFRDKQILEQALVHKSYLHQVPDYYLGSNERLEFLGDAVLGLIVSADLFRSRPDISEGRLTALRGALVRKNTLAELGAPFKLGDYLYMSRGEEVAGGRTRASNLAHAVEAILGAVYMDGGLDATIEVWHRLLGDHDEERLLEVLRGDYKSQLQQFTQAEMRLTPYYRLVDTIGPEHSKEFRVEVLVGDRVLSSGIGRNKQTAEQAAAEAALRDLVTEAMSRPDEESDENIGDVGVTEREEMQELKGPRAEGSIDGAV